VVAEKKLTPQEYSRRFPFGLTGFITCYHTGSYQ
jgi:hypothetical protein